jgi:thioredoxin 1
MQVTERKATFEEMLQSEPLVLVDFFAEWCGPCKMMKPILEQLKADVGHSVKILKVDVDRNPGAAARYEIQGVPTLILFRRGDIVWRQAGVVQVNRLKQLIEQYKAA